MNSYFQFKQFRIDQQLAAMKVGTDSVLLGSWATALSPKRIMDIGTGTGLIALMMAQRFDLAQIDAIELDPQACLQARGNFQNSDWRNRIQLHQQDFIDYNSPPIYDLIVSNPPYFDPCPQSNNRQRMQARQTETLNHQQLFTGVSKLLQPKGVFALIIPTQFVDQILIIAQKLNLCCQQQLCIYPTPTAISKRCLLSFAFTQTEINKQTLLIELSRHHYSPEYQQLTKDFYLAF